MVNIGESYKFNYPEHFKTLPDYSNHRGVEVKVIRKLDPDESDFEMYEIESADGWRGHAFSDELSDS